MSWFDGPLLPYFINLCKICIAVRMVVTQRVKVRMGSLRWAALVAARLVVGNLWDFWALDFCQVKDEGIPG
jgi:hypothetical protein